jgi:hypothetical protein
MKSKTKTEILEALSIAYSGLKGEWFRGSDTDPKNRALLDYALQVEKLRMKLEREL